MNTAILMGALSAALYGVTDFVARFAGRAVGVYRTMLYGQLLAAIALTAIVAIGPIPFAVGSPGAWAAAIAGDLMILSATAMLYRALSTGSLVVVAPICASYGAVSALLAIASGERYSTLALVGLALAVLGAVLASIPPRAIGVPKERDAGALPATGAAIGYGVGFWLQGAYAVPVLGHWLPVWSYYALGSVLLLVFGATTRRELSPPPGKALFYVLLAGAGAVAAYVALATGQASGQIAVVTALSSAASAVTVLLALVFLRERMTLFTALGVLGVVGGLVLLHLA